MSNLQLQRNVPWAVANALKIACWIEHKGAFFNSSADDKESELGISGSLTKRPLNTSVKFLHLNMF